jgi:hypothetical protein
VRVEDEFSLGRSYSTLSSWREVRAVPGLGAQRRALTSRSFQPYADGAAPVLEAATMSLVNLRAATRADVLAYFRNTWALTDTLFSALATDASFYMVPDKLRRPLIFYFGHPAALYINKMHQAGLVGALFEGGGLRGGAPQLPRRRARSIFSAPLPNPTHPPPAAHPARPHQRLLPKAV